MNSRNVLVSLAAAFCFGSVSAKVTTIGTPTCADWGKVLNAQHKNWFAGFMSGISFAYSAAGNNDDPLRRLRSTDQAHLWVDNYCKSNPLDDLSTAGIKLFDELLKRK